MSEFAIRAERLGKQYRIGRASSARYTTLRDTIGNLLSAPVRGSQRFLKRRTKSAGRHCEATADRFWALRDVSFEVGQGEVVGFIGRNGAGKSTLLKILSRITDPTEGIADIQGRVGSLLEVGSGFHPELTGRENIYLNGAILGMTRREIQAKFDEIAAFAEVERFIDTAVKHYSSGMYLRLAFAVAAHLETEVLMVDEVLAVGDASFQKKCLGKMQNVSREGRTVLFVSHNLPAVTGLCDRVILLEDGAIQESGAPHDVVHAYLNTGLHTNAAREWPEESAAPRSDLCRLHAVRIRADDARVSESFDIREPIRVEMEFEVFEDGYVLMPHFWLTNETGIELFSAHDVDPAWRRRMRPAGRYVSTVWIPGNFLSDGAVFVSAGCVSLNPVVQRQFVAPDVAVFRVVESLHEDTARGDYPGAMEGVVRPLLDWTTEFTPPSGVRDPVALVQKPVQ